MYATREIAEDVLIETQTRYDYGANGGPIQFGKLVVEFVDAPAPDREDA